MAVERRVSAPLGLLPSDEGNATHEDVVEPDAQALDLPLQLGKLLLGRRWLASERLEQGPKPAEQLLALCRRRREKHSAAQGQQTVGRDRLGWSGSRPHQRT